MTQMEALHFGRPPIAPPATSPPAPQDRQSRRMPVNPSAGDTNVACMVVRHEGEDDVNITDRLREAGRHWEQPEEAEAILLATQRDAPNNEDVQVALYRFYFYRHAFDKALQHAQTCIARGARELGLPADWRSLQAQDIDFGDFDNPKHRFLLFSLNAWGYLLARTGQLDRCEEVLAVVKRLDPQDRIGAARLLAVVRAGPAPDDADSD